MDQLKPMLAATGFSLPGPAYLFGALVFGLVGLGAFRYGRQAENARVKWLGMALMLYPYLVTSTGPMFAVGIALCAALWFSR